MPKEIIYFGIGLVLVVLLGGIASNMFLQEMLFFEGVEKSVQIFTEEELREFGEKYKELSIDFQNQIGAYIQDYANRTNRAGEKIHYGVFNHIHPNLNTSKIKKHSNGSNITTDDNDKKSDTDDSYNDYPDSTDDWSTFIDSDEFKNGVTIKYAKTDGRDNGESNLQDILIVMSMLLDQKGTRDGNNVDNINIKEKAPELLKQLFKMSHTFTGTTIQLYSCEKGCRVFFYYCNEEDNRYKDTGIDLQPFQINPHNELEDYSEEDFDIVSPQDECVICGHNGKGCELDSELCYHGVSDEESSCKYIMGSEGDCEKNEPHSICTYEGNGDHDCSDSPIGCGGHYDCMGHEHWNCQGHFYVCCMGHTDITINIKIMYIDEIVNVIKNGYLENIGE
ncbi:MAG: hypothetical protein Q4F88_05140 [Eubacteriales bacterium]|nr:hypothetical protein [Eubacteriales bacterium]